MKKIVHIGFILFFLCIILATIFMVISFVADIGVLTIIASLYLIVGIKLFKLTYPEILFENRKSERWCKPLSTEELEIVEDAKELIKSVDSNIVISEFNVYKVRFMMRAWFRYHKDTQELNIFIPFKFLFRLGGKNLCFWATLHEVLHSQNLKNNSMFFKIKFLEGLNQFLTIWLIENYSEKYSIPKDKKISIRLIRKLYVDITITSLAGTSYTKEVKMVKEILQKSNIDFKEVFLKYINFQPEFFKSFVPSKYYQNQ